MPRHEVGALAVLEAEHVVAHHGPAAAGLPQLAGMEGGQEEFLADLVHLFADDVHDLVEGAVAQEEIGVDSGGQLADVSGADQEFVAGDFGVGRGFAQGRDEELGPAMHS